jgi:hypothetical protein
MGIATLICWALTASIGARMLASMIARGGLRRPGSGGDHLPPAVLAGHFGLALTGLAVWIAYLLAGRTWLAWLAVGLLMPAIGLGISTVTLWTPYPGLPGAPQDPLPGSEPARPRGRALVSQLPDEALSSALADEMMTGALVDDMIDTMLAGPPQARSASRWRLRALIPVGHGLGATVTFLLAVLTAAGMR